MATVLDRIREIALESDLDCDISELVDFHYKWTNGYEILTARKKGGGGFEYAGSYHPNGYCEGISICTHCGRTLEFDF